MLLTHKAASQKNNASDVYPTFAAMYLLGWKVVPRSANVLRHCFAERFCRRRFVEAEKHLGIRLVLGSSRYLPFAGSWAALPLAAALASSLTAARAEEARASA